MVSLVLDKVLGGDAFAEVGQPTGVYPSPDGRMVAVAGTFGHYQWPARTIETSRSFIHRVVVYDTRTLNLLGQIDAGMFPTNDIAWHPREQLLAVGTGSYDGGYYFEGQLLLWDLREGQLVAAFDQLREVVTCAFDREENLHLVVMPGTDDLKGSDQAVPLATTVHRDIWKQLRDGCITAYELPEQEVSLPERPITDPAGQLSKLARSRGRNYESRWMAWDVALAVDGRILCVRNNTALEIWSSEGHRVYHLPHESDGVQVVLSPDGELAWSNLWRYNREGDWRENYHRHAQVLGIDLDRYAVEDLRLGFPALLQISANGDVLARDVSHDSGDKEYESKDCVVLPDGARTEPLNLGHYGAWAHYMRIDGAPEFYFLKDVLTKLRLTMFPPQPIWVFRLSPASPVPEQLFPLEWNPSRGPVMMGGLGPQDAHLMGGLGVYLADAQGESLVLASEIYSPDPKGRQWELARRMLPDGRAMWGHALPHQATAMAAFLEAGLIAFALRDGSIGLLGARDGEIVDLAPAAIDGVPTVILSLAARGDRVAAGTIDGRIAIYRLDR